MAKNKTLVTVEPAPGLSKTAQAEIALQAVRDLNIVPENPIRFIGNYAEITADIEASIGKYRSLKIKDSNFAEGELAKKMCQVLRTNITNRFKEWKDANITLPSETEKAKSEKVLSIVLEIEENLDKQFEVYDNEKREALTEILNGYVEAACAAEGLSRSIEGDAEYIDRIELKPKYYNKTQKEADSKSDIEEQVKTLKRERDEKLGTIKLIRSMCAEDARLDVDTYIANLEFQSASVVMQSIVDAKERLKTVKVGETNEKVVDGLKLCASPKGKKAGAELKEMRVKITYPASSGKKLKEFFDTNPEIKVMTIV